MTSVEELKEVLKEHLEQQGVLDEIRSSLRAQIFNSLNDKPLEKNPVSHENLLINELVKEYLEFNNYNYSQSVFESECGNPAEKLDRQIISKKLNVVENAQTKKLPLLYSLVFGQRTTYSKPNFVEKDENDQKQENKQDYTYKSIFELNQ